MRTRARSIKGKICSVSECSRPVQSKNLCSMHYARYWFHGTTELVRKSAKTNCSIENCKYSGKIVRGWCPHHYEIWRRTGNPLTVTNYKSTLGDCEVPTCSLPIHCHGLCSQHYHLYTKYNIDPIHIKTMICYICEKEWSTWNPREMQIDHIIPITKGGTTTRSNLSVTCRKCNHSKSNMTYDELIEWCRHVISIYELSKKTE